MQNQDGIWLHFSSQTYSFGSAWIMNLSIYKDSVTN